MRICAVQLRPIAGDIAINIARHLKFIELAIAESADLVFFPELSLTGYESLQPEHAKDAANMGANIYLASVAKPAGAMARAMLHYPAIARKYNLHVIMADCVGPSDDFVSVGQSAIWNNRGELLAQMDSQSEGIIILDTASDQASIRGSAG
jgi:predicted amidohydrolase